MTQRIYSLFFLLFLLFNGVTGRGTSKKQPSNYLEHWQTDNRYWDGLEPSRASFSSRTYLPFVTSNQYSNGIWVSKSEIQNLPTTGPAWESLVEAAQINTNYPNIRDQNDDMEIFVLAKALVYVRTGETRYRTEVVSAILKAIRTEEGGRILALGRNLVGYIIAADLIDLSINPQNDRAFRNWLSQLLDKELNGLTLRTTHETRPNNWGTHAGAARAAIALYLEDGAELARTAKVFKGFLGNRAAYAGFKFGDLSWQCYPNEPVGINPKNCFRYGFPLDGVLPDEQRRGGGFVWPPTKTNYYWEGLQGAIVQAQLLYRAGYPVWYWEDQALLRSFNWIYEVANFPAEGDDEWQPWLINAVYGTDFPTISPAQFGKNMGWTDWTAAIQP